VTELRRLDRLARKKDEQKQQVIKFHLTGIWKFARLILCKHMSDVLFLFSPLGEDDDGITSV
jgi:hypothetical protein